MTLEDAVHSMSYKIMFVIGGATGIMTSAFTENLDKILLTFVLGFVGAMGAGLAKLLVDKIGKHGKDKP